MTGSTEGATGAAPRLTVAVTVDHDAISDAIRRGDPVVKLSHGEFGPRVGAPRILELLERRGIPSTWFVPGHTLETFPDSTAAILAGGHELACHGWFHEDFGELSTDEQRAVLERSAEAVERVTGSRAGRLASTVLGTRAADAGARRGGRVRLRLVADGRRLRAPSCSSW